MVAFMITPCQRRSRVYVIQASPTTATPVIPHPLYCKRLHPFDPERYTRGNLVEHAFCRIKDFRIVTTRHGKRTCAHAAAVSLAAIIV
ncbi:hypothetical protein [Brevundimonas sp.]|uniref:hypothetical protein n=1 Tax=Brevundimonas sp. TaxID=1871086 RepID=UPI003D0BAC87